MPAACEVKREVYMRSPRPHVAVTVGVQYVGRGLRREERRACTGSSDWSDAMCVRRSEDNGRTWSDWELLDQTWPTQGNCTKEQSPSSHLFDPVSGLILRTVFQRILLGDLQHALEDYWKGNQLFFDHGFWQVSADYGQTWGDLHQFKYEDGPSFDPHDWGNTDFLHTNEMYIGYYLTILRDGSILFPVCLPVEYHDDEDLVVADLAYLTGKPDHVTGILCFIGRWNQAKGTYEWAVSQPFCVPRRVSWRGLDEPAAAQLSGGNVLMVMRGSSTKVTPGRRWMSVSSDGGRTWGPVTDLRYDNGGQFYSPASPSALIRSSKTAKLYWVGNISRTPPEGNSPRYPLCIAEVDEQIPALKRDSFTVIDDRDPEHDTPLLQVTNFSLLENRETHDLELYLTRLGERGDGQSHTGDFWTSDAYKYILSF